MSVRLGDRKLYEADAVPATSATWSLFGNTAQALLNEQVGLVEHYEVRREGVQATWVLQRRPPGEGSLIVEAGLQGLRYQSKSEHGHHYAAAAGMARARIGKVTRRWHGLPGGVA